MLGMEDDIIALAWILTVLSGVGCALFGLIFWNRQGDESE
ncbi:symporter small accessory protein [Virgibacillus kekensis]|uniref:Symporter small accessory protein n=1 Tax=Virgibacillus kekensis TaxID=202261 RepID=A0ABV9DIT0_9BACI